MRKFWTCALTVLFLFVIPSRAEVQTAARAAVLLDADSGRVLYEKNPDEMLPMASTTKIMTCLLALETCKLDETVTASHNAHGTPGTSIYLGEGETLTMEQMLNGLMLRSGNDAAVAIAEHVSGSQEAFVERMNERARELGIDAHFANPHGLDAEDHAASARAMALLLRECLKNEDFARITATQKKIIPWTGNEYSRVLTNKNRLLRSYEGATGGKTGYTSKAGRCLVFSAERNGMRLVGAVLNCSAWFDTAQTLLDYGFETYEPARIYETGDLACQIPVTGGERRTVDLTAAEPLCVPLKENETYELALEIPERVEAPVKEGDRAGHACVYIEGEKIAEADLIYGESVARNSMEQALRRVIGAWVLN